MNFSITWIYKNDRQYTQVLTLSNCRDNGNCTFNGAIYEAIANGSFYIDLGYGKHYFKLNDV